MKKCPSCGLENPDDAAHCQKCQTPLGAGALAAPPARANWLRRILPYLLSYLLVASGAFLFNYISGQRHAVPFPPHIVILDTTLPSDDVIATLEKAGVPKDAVLGALAPRPQPWPVLLHHLILFGVCLFAFLALINLFKRFLKL